VNYIVISPVKDEEKYVETTINALVNQTAKPARWILVDDGSTDGTPEILHKYSTRYSWIDILKTNRNAPRQPGSPVINAFNRGYELIKNEEFDIIVKLDCDLDFKSDYFEMLLSEFNQDKTLGIASGIYLEKRNKAWSPVKMPYYHTAGACKVVRKNCFEEIGGFIPSKGWDTIDEIRAQMNGWTTRHFESLKLHHLKNEGSGIGFLKTNAMHGEIFYLTGGSKIFFIMKVIHRMIFGQPFMLGGIMTLLGYLKPFLSRKHLLVNPEEAEFYQLLLNKRILNTLNPKKKP
jgi:glycosyltransferase involved in cell wall biosynthesis